MGARVVRGTKCGVYMVAMWGILPKGMIELKKRVLKDNVANITRSGKHYKPSFYRMITLVRTQEKDPNPWFQR